MFRNLSAFLRAAFPALVISLMPSLVWSQVNRPASRVSMTQTNRAAADDSAPPKTDRIGVINFQAVIANSAEGKKTLADLQTKYAPKHAEIERLQREIQLSRDQLTKQQAMLSDDQQARLSRDVEVKQRDLKRTTEDAQNDFNHDRDEAVNRIGRKIVTVINQYATENGFELILDEAQVPVYFVSPRIDVTKDIIARYDAANPAATAGQ